MSIQENNYPEVHSSEMQLNEKNYSRYIYKIFRFPQSPFCLSEITQVQFNSCSFGNWKLYGEQTFVQTAVRTVPFHVAAKGRK